MLTPMGFTLQHPGLARSKLYLAISAAPFDFRPWFKLIARIGGDGHRRKHIFPAPVSKRSKDSRIPPIRTRLRRYAAESYSYM